MAEGMARATVAQATKPINPPEEPEFRHDSTQSVKDDNINPESIKDDTPANSPNPDASAKSASPDGSASRQPRKTRSRRASRRSSRSSSPQKNLPERPESRLGSIGSVKDDNPVTSSTDDVAATAANHNASANSANPGASANPADFDASANSQPRHARSRRSSRRSSSSSSPRHKGGMDALLTFFGDGYELFEVGNGGEVRKLDAVPDEKTIRRNKRNFILRRKTTHQRAHEAARVFGGQGTATNVNVDRFDYERKYPPDEPGQEQAPGARVWRVYMDEAGQFDLDMVENMRDTVDVILVFAGLFSAIVTTLVVLTATALQLDQPKVTNLLLMELIALQRTSIAGASVDQVTPSPLNAESASNSTADVTDYWINGLWFTSLAFSLSTALIAVLVRQWIQAYVAPTFQGTPKAQAEVRHFRYRGIETWHVPLIIGLLPTLLHLSLFLFFAGLVVFLFTLDIAIASVVTIITSIACIAYIVTNLLLVSYAGCPYQTPLSHYAFFILHTCKTWYTWFSSNRGSTFKGIWTIFILALYTPFALAIRTPWYLFARRPATCWGFVLSPIQSVHGFMYTEREGKPTSLKEMESQAITRDGDGLHDQMFEWLIQTSAANLSARAIVLPCLQDLSNIAHLKPIISRADWNKALQRMILFHVTSSETTLDRARLEAVFAKIPGTNPHSNYEIVDGLTAVQEYRKAAVLSFVKDETYNIVSDVDWDSFGSYSAGEVFLQRFCFYVLATFPLPLLSHDGRFYSNHLPHLLPAIRRWTHHVRPTSESLHTLKQWLPTPALTESLALDISQLRNLLQVGTFLLESDLEFMNTFKEVECLVFWRRVYERHIHTITQDLVEAFHEMIRVYLCQIWENDLQEDHLLHVFKHLPTLCLWHAALPADEPMQEYMDHLAHTDPWNPMWQEVQDSLPALLEPPSDERVQEYMTALALHLQDLWNPMWGEAQDLLPSLLQTAGEKNLSGAALLQKLAALLQKERGEQPRPSPPGAPPSPLPDESQIRSSPEQPSNIAAALEANPTPDTALVPSLHGNTLDVDNRLPALRVRHSSGSGQLGLPIQVVDVDTTGASPIDTMLTGASDAPLEASSESNAVVPAASTVGHPDPGGSTTSLWASVRRRPNLDESTNFGSIV